MKKRLVLFGGGGHAKSIIDSINTMGLYKIIGIIDRKEKRELPHGVMSGSRVSLFLVVVLSEPNSEHLHHWHK